MIIFVKSAFTACLTIFMLATLFCMSANAIITDPTKPFPDEPKVEAIADNYGLSAILISSDRRLAVVNGKLLQIGDSVDNGKVLAINTNSVVIEAPTGKQELKLFTNTLKQIE
jgi:hypothetical protein